MNSGTITTDELLAELATLPDARRTWTRAELDMLEEWAPLAAAKVGGWKALAGRLDRPDGTKPRSPTAVRLKADWLAAQGGDT